MERKAKSSIRTQFQLSDGKIATLQPDPECKEVNRMVADLNRRVVRVQTHGLTSWERQREQGRPRGFGVEVAREAVEEDDLGASGSTPFYSTDDRPEQHNGTVVVVQQYLHNLERIEGKPGPIKRSLRRWLYGKPTTNAAGELGDSCCCRQVEAVAGKVTIAEASDMKDEAVDRLLVDVYFHPPQKQGIARRVFRRASEMSKKICEQVKSAVGRIGRGSTEARVEKGGSTREKVGEGAGAKAGARQSRQSRPASVTEGPLDSGNDHPQDRSSVSGRLSQHNEDRELDQIPEESEEAPREERPNSENAPQLDNATGSLTSQDKRASAGEQQGILQTGHKVDIYQMLLKGVNQNEHDSNSSSNWPKTINFTPHARNRTAKDRPEIAQEDTVIIEESETGALQNERNLPQCNHHETVLQADSKIDKIRMNIATGIVNSEHNEPNSESSSVCSLAPHVSEKLKLPDQEYLDGTDIRTSGTYFKGERTDKLLDDSEQKLAMLNSEQNEPNSERSRVRSLVPYVGGTPKLPDQESLGGIDIRTSDTHFKGERTDKLLEDSEQKLDLQKSDQRNSQGVTRRVVGTLEVFIMSDSSEFMWDASKLKREFSEEMTLASQNIGDPESDEEALQNNDDTKLSSMQLRKENKFPDERPLQDSDGAQKHDYSEPSCSTSHAKEEQEITAESELLEEDNQDVENDGRFVRTVKRGRNTM